MSLDASTTTSWNLEIYSGAEDVALIQEVKAS